MLTEAELGALLAAPGGDPLVWSPEQFTAITAPAHPHLVVAGAGSGKTTVMTARILWLVGNGEVEPDRILGLTFTNKAAGEFGDRCARGLERLRERATTANSAAVPQDYADDVVGEPSISTYHSFAQRLLADHGLRIGYEPGASLMHEVTRRQLAYRTVQRTRAELVHVSTNAASVSSSVLALDDLLAERLIDPERLIEHDRALAAWLTSLHGTKAWQAAGEQMLATALARIEIAGLVQEFRAAKRERYLVDFADQMSAAAQLAQHLAASQPDAVAALREQYQVVLLDEYQDTSVAQRRMLQALFGEGHCIMAVGDPCQAIYGWRGASVFNIDAFAEDFLGLGGSAGTHSPLTEVRRCAPEILEVANTISEPLRAKHPLVQPLRPDANSTKQGSVHIARLLTQEQETAWVAQQVQDLASDFLAKDTAVLCRVNGDLARVAQALDAAGVPYDVVGVTALLSRPEVADVVAVLRLLSNPGHNASLVRVLAGPRWAIGVRDLAALGHRALAMNPREKQDPARPVAEQLASAVREQDPADVAALSDVLEAIAQGERIPDLSDAAAQRCAALVQELRRLRRHVGEPVADLVRRVCAATGLDVQMRLGPEHLVATRIRAMETLVELAEDFIGIDGSRSLHDFLRWLDDAVRFDKVPSVEVPATGEFVRLMTVHASKGLEFDAVVLPYLVEGVFPSSRGRKRWPSSAVALPPDLLEDRERAEVFPQYPDRGTGPRAKDHNAFKDHMRAGDLLEETRLAYVAVTRARFRVVASGHVWGPTQVRPRAASPWLTAMHDYLVGGGAGIVEEWVDDPPKGEQRPPVQQTAVSWPPAEPQDAVDARRAGAALVRAARAGESVPVPAPAADDPEIAQWAADVDTLIAAWRRGNAAERDVLLPSGLSASDAMRLIADEQDFALQLARPVPRVSNEQASRGTRFHAYVEDKWRGELALFARVDVDDIVEEPMSDPELDELIAAFEAGPFAHRPPHDVEVEFTAVFGEVTVRGRIDAVFDCGDGSWEVIDWKTNTREDADPVQLAIYRHAWAALRGVAPEQVRAGFYYVRTATTDMHAEDLMTYDELCEALGGAKAGAAAT
ncbi:MAG: ATP-dependent helicase [Actinomycetales bacterium]|nr:ATP-dependent helicase [Actinomycetales bacterium]